MSSTSRLSKLEEDWKREDYDRFIRATGDHGSATTPSGIQIKPLVTSVEMGDMRYEERLGFPGRFPFTRGIYPTMYRGKPWTIRMVSGYATPEASNERFKFLLSQGATGLSLALDSPTIYGYDSDDPRVQGEVGQGGAPISSINDIEIAFRDIPIDKISVNLITHYLGLHVFSMFVALADKLGIDREKLRGTTQDDPLWFFHVGNPVLPLAPSVRLAVDLLEFCVKQGMVGWFSNSVSGYHIREAGANAIQEASFTIADATVYVDEALRRGLVIDEIAPHMSFFLSAHDNLLEEIAKFRAMRRVWAKIMKERYNAKNPRSWQFRFHAQTAGSALTAQEPLNNVVRATIHALAAILGGCQSLHVDAYNEALGLPTERAAKLGLRTQQIILHESGLPDFIDPLGGSYHVEYLTDRVEEAIWTQLEAIEASDGMYEYTQAQIPRSAITENSFRTHTRIERGEICKVGINVAPGPIEDLDFQRVTLQHEELQAKRTRALRMNRNQERVDDVLQKMKDGLEREENVIPYCVESVKAFASTGEIYQVLKDAFGVAPAPTIF